MLKFFSALLAITSIVTLAEPLTDNISHRLRDLSALTGVSIAELEDGVRQAQLVPKIIETMERPWEAKPWYQYAPIFLTQKRVNQGVKFWKAHESVISKAAQQYGIPEQIIVAIIGVETFYGRHKGTYPVIDALYTLGFHYPKRSAFFSKEFAYFIQLNKQQNWSIRETNGSYAGAMGLGQFIPSSYLHYGVDFNADGQIDMLNDPVDAIGSVANYFRQHNWHTGEPVVYPIDATQEQVTTFKTDTLKPETHWSAMQKAGITLQQSLPDETPVKLLELKKSHNQPTYWLTLHNFYVITRYNHSPLYAMAVYQLSEQIRDAYKQK